MRRPALYSSSSRPAAQPGASVQAAERGTASPEAPAAAATDPAPDFPPKSRRFRLSQPRLLWAAIGVLGAGLLVSVGLQLRPAAHQLTQKDIDNAVLHTLAHNVMPSAAARAAEAVRPSLVRVVGYVKGKDGKADVQNGVGSGVVIVDKGIILTNLHVVQGTDSIKVTFSDGLESTASITGLQPENDLAVLQAHKIPDDMIAATMRSTGDLAPGDEVVAVGFPFGIGPSVSSGVISGLKRSFRSPEGKQEMSNLIQFDAAANPGNSGGPLVTMDGEVVGIVTGILNPTNHRTFVGIGFAVPIENAAAGAGMPPF